MIDPPEVVETGERHTAVSWLTVPRDQSQAVMEPAPRRGGRRQRSSRPRPGLWTAARTVVLAAALAACAAPGRPTGACAAALEGQVVELLDTLAADLHAEGPEAWARHCAPSFVMASDGAVAFATHDQLVAFVEGFDREVDSMTLTWREPRVTPLGAGLAHFGAGYDEVIVGSDGREQRFGGYVTGLVVRQGQRWRFERLHWSSPAAGTDGG